MNRVKDVVIVVLLLAIAYLLATRDASVGVSDEPHTTRPRQSPYYWSETYERDADSTDPIAILIADAVASQIENSLDSSEP